MNSAQDVTKLIDQFKASCNTMSEAAWQTALACVGWPYVFGARGQYCTPANRRARDYTSHPTIKTNCKAFTASDSEGCPGCKWYPNNHYVRCFDCRGFTYWVLKQIYGWELMGAGCTSQWNDSKNWKAKGEVSDGIPQNVIVCLFYYKKDSKGKRTSTLEHTGFYYNGQTIECSSGVQHSKTLNKKWEVWGIPACAEGSGEVINMPTLVVTEPAKESLPTLRKGSKGQYVTLLQTKLLNKGYALPRYGADGDYGTETLNAVKAFQKANGLTADGVVGEKTWKALNDATVAIPYYTVTVSHLTEDEKNKLMSEYGDRVINTVEG